MTRGYWCQGPYNEYNISLMEEDHEQFQRLAPKGPPRQQPQSQHLHSLSQRQAGLFKLLPSSPKINEPSSCSSRPLDSLIRKLAILQDSHSTELHRQPHHSRPHSTTSIRNIIRSHQITPRSNPIKQQLQMPLEWLITTKSIPTTTYHSKKFSKLYNQCKEEGVVEQLVSKRRKRRELTRITLEMPSQQSRSKEMWERKSMSSFRTSPSMRRQHPSEQPNADRVIFELLTKRRKIKTGILSKF